MAPATLALVGVVNSLTAAIFAAVGLRVARRAHDPGHSLAIGALAAWWIAMALVVGLQAVETFAAVAGILSLPLSTTVRIANGPLLALGGWGFCFHIVYLVTGSRRLAVPMVPFFALVGLGYIASVVLHPLVSLEPLAYELSGTYDPPLDGPLWNAVLASVGLPLIIASITYLSLAPKLTRRDQKRRAALASSGILAWVSAGLVAQLTAGPIADFLTYTVLGMLAGALVFVAYFPPRFLRRGDAIGEYVEVARSPKPPTPGR